MQTLYGNIPDKAVDISLQRFQGKVFKILPMTEEECLTIDKYISSLLREFIGSKHLIENLSMETDFLSLIGTLQYLKDGKYDLDVCRTEVLKACNIIKRMRRNLNKGGR